MQLSHTPGATAVVFDAILNRSPVAPVRLNPDVPARLEEIINKLLDKDRELRYQHASDLEADLKRFKRDSNPNQAATAVATPAAVSPSPVLVPSAPLPPRNRNRIKYLILTAVVVVIAAIAATHFYRQAAAPLTERDVILIADFLNTTGDAAFDGTLKQALAVQLEQSPFLNIFPEDRIREALRFMERSPDERVTESVAREICQREGLKAVLDGSIAAIGSHFAVALDAVGRPGLAQALRTARLLVRDMLRPNGSVVFQRRRGPDSRVPFIRWTAAPSFRALARLSRATGARSS